MLNPGLWRYAPHMVVFFSSAFIMVLEIVAGRLIARHLGSSLYTWTSIIGIILAGMSIGNYVGGRLADRWRPEALLGSLFFVASALCLSVLVLNRVFSDNEFMEGLMLPLRTFVAVIAIFLVPAMALGTISPAAAKLAIERSDSVGKTVGSVYAWGAVGSIGGTFLAGFWLIAALGSKGVVLSVSFALALMAAFLGPRRWLAALWTAAVAGLLILSQVPSVKDGTLETLAETFDLPEGQGCLYAADSHYQFVKVAETMSRFGNNRKLHELKLDYLIHGYVDLKDPSHLEYDYECVYRDVVRRFVGEKKSVSAFFIGGGSYTFPRWTLHEWPGSKIDVAEIDPVVVEANHHALGLPLDTPIRTFVGDARNVVDGLPKNARYDLVVGDAFNDLSIPFHLTTLEFNRKIARHLSPGGLYMVNLIDDYKYGRLLGAYVLTLRKTFKHVHVFCTRRDGVREGRDTFVIAASMVPGRFEDCRAGHGGSFPGSMLAEENLMALADKADRRILTDDDAPVENLLEPVVRHRY